MDIHNLMEDLVVSTVDELFDEEPLGETRGYCRCKQCRIDVSCYVLNRIKPEYVQSGRGFVYSSQELKQNNQKKADIASLIKEGWSRISSTPRANHSGLHNDEPIILPKGSVFNIRPIMGRLLNGITFEPIINANIALYDQDDLVRMMDDTWPNPYPLVHNTAGMFTFWLYPVVAPCIGERHTFSFTLEAHIDGYEKFSRYIDIESISESKAISQFSMNNVHHLEDMYIFPK